MSGAPDGHLQNRINQVAKNARAQGARVRFPRGGERVGNEMTTTSNDIQHFINAGMEIERDNIAREIAEAVKRQAEQYWRVEQANKACDILSPELTKNTIKILKGFHLALKTVGCEVKVLTETTYNEAGESAGRIYEVDVINVTDNFVIKSLRCYEDDYLTPSF